MSTGEYPRIERRREQLEMANSVQSPLERLHSTSILLDPEQRPSARMICEQMQAIRNNDRHYPPARRVPPQSDIGVMGRKWIGEQINLRVKDTKLALEQTSRRLAAEEARWRDEAERADSTSKSLKEREDRLSSVSESLEAQQQRADSAERTLASLQQQVSALSEELVDSKQIVGQLEKDNKSLSQSIIDKDEKIKSLRRFNDKSNAIVEELSRSIQKARDAEATALVKEREARLTMEMGEEQAKELEVRLEQALMRWKKEKENTFAQSVLSAKFRSQNGHLIDANKRLEFEVKMVNERLSKYESLDGPEELHARLKVRTTFQLSTSLACCS